MLSGCVIVTQCGDPQQQIFNWFKTLSDKQFKSCDKKSNFEFKESNVLIDNVPCKPKKRRVSKVFQFYDYDYTKEITKETDDYFRGKGNLLLYNTKEEKM